MYNFDITDSILDQTSFQLAKTLGFNIDIFDTNIINLAILWFLLITFLGELLKESLEERSSSIQKLIQTSEASLEQSQQALTEAKAKLTNLSDTVDPMINEANINAEKLKETILDNGKNTIKAVVAQSMNQVVVLENQVRQQAYIEVVVDSMKVLKVDFEKLLKFNTKYKYSQNQINQI